MDLELSNMLLLLPHGDVFKTVEVEKGITTTLDVLFEEHSGTLVPRGTSPNVETTVHLDNTFYAPITQGQILGEIIYLIDGEEYRQNQFNSCL